MRRIFLGFALVGVAVGGAVTAFWLRSGLTDSSDAVARTRALPVFASVAVLSTLTLAIRWLRWHFLTRRVIRELPTRTSLVLYFGTLPAFATPLYAGELLRSALAARRLPRARPAVFLVWLLERALDVYILVLFALVARGSWGAVGALAVAGGIGALLVSRFSASRSLRQLSRFSTVASVAVLSAFAWSLPVLGLLLTVEGFGHSIGLRDTANAFSIGTLLGGVSLLPLGVGVAGSAMIVALERAGAPATTAIASVALFRYATTWYAFALGVLALIRWRRQLLAVVSDPATTRERFDELSAEYPDQIPEHVRERIIGRKVEAMTSWLARVGAPPGARGLDLGCGQGWYAAELARAGYSLTACDGSLGQLDAARCFTHQTGAPVTLLAADARRLPFSDESFDFAYAVNAIHHITESGSQARALDEIARILKPGGSFFLQEINTENPLFAFYMGYMFPLLRDIDDGTELWIKPGRLPPVAGTHWDDAKVYLTFLPDFAPRSLVRLLAGVERSLETSRLRTWSAHFIARLVRDG